MNSYARCLATAVTEAMEYGNDDTIGVTELENFVKNHLEDFTELVADYVSERV